MLKDIGKDYSLEEGLGARINVFDAVFYLDESRLRYDTTDLTSSISTLEGLRDQVPGNVMNLSILASLRTREEGSNLYSCFFDHNKKDEADISELLKHYP